MNIIIFSKWYLSLYPNCSVLSVSLLSNFKPFLNE